MNLDSAAAAQLKAFSERIGEPDLAIAVLELARFGGLTIPSYLATRFTIYGPEQLFTVTGWSVSAKTEVVRSSLRLEIPTGDPRHQLCVVFFAESHNAFAEFREHCLRVADPPGAPLGDRLTRLVIDQDVPKSRLAGSAVKGLSTLGPLGASVGDRVGDPGALERAVGVLMNDGFSVEAAKEELGLRAAQAQRSVLEEAQELLRSLVPTGPAG
jgi:hypothetical protein